MADNAAITAGAGTIIAADDIGGVLHQRVKIQYGEDGSATDVSTAAPLPISDAGGSLTVDGTVAVTNAGLTTLAGAVSGTEMQVDVLTMPTVTVNAHAVTNAGTFATQVDGAALTALQLLDNIVLAEDAVHGSGDPGVQLLAVRKDAAAAIAGTDGDYTPLQVDANGALRVTGGTSSTQYAEDAAHASGDTGTMVLVVRRDANTTLAGTDGDYAPLQVSAAGALKVAIVEDSVGSAVVDEDGSVAVGGTNVAQVVSTDYQYDGSALVRVRGPLTVAHDAADAGNPAKIGAVAETALSGRTLVADGDRTDLLAGVDGVLYTRNVCLEDVVQERATNTDGAATAFASGLAAPGANIRLWIKSVTIANSSASFCTVDLRDGAAGSVLWTFPVPATGGVTHLFDPPLKLTANTALAYDASAAISTITISANGFKSKV
jgi:hypothetical protein